MRKKLVLSQTDRIVAGVCGGVGEYFNVDSTIIRIVFGIAIIVGFGSPLLVYFVLFLIMKYGNRNSY